MITTTKKAFLKIHKEGKLSLVAAGRGILTHTAAALYNTPTKNLSFFAVGKTIPTTRLSVEGKQNSIKLMNNRDGHIFYIVIDDDGAYTCQLDDDKQHLTIYKYEG